MFPISEKELKIKKIVECAVCFCILVISVFFISNQIMADQPPNQAADQLMDTMESHKQKDPELLESTSTQPAIAPEKEMEKNRAAFEQRMNGLAAKQKKLQLREKMLKVMEGSSLEPLKEKFQEIKKALAYPKKAWVYYIETLQQFGQNITVTAKIDVLPEVRWMLSDAVLYKKPSLDSEKHKNILQKDDPVLVVSQLPETQFCLVWTDSEFGYLLKSYLEAIDNL